MSPKSKLNVATLNVRGLNNNNINCIEEDLEKYNIDICAIQETHLLGEGIIEQQTKSRKYILYYTGPTTHKHHGVGIICNQDLNPAFKTISERLCTAEIIVKDQHNNKNKITFISAYAPTLLQSLKYPEKTESFYNQLSNTIKKCSKRNMIILGGDFNAKTGSGHNEFSENIGKYGKGEINSNGRHLLEMAREHELILTNTLYQHKMAHRTTWECPQRIKPHQNKYGEIRRNPYRNQIDYIIMRKRDQPLITNARSYSGLKTNTDHRIVITNIKIQWYRTYQRSKSNIKPKYDIQKLNNKEHQKKYKEKLEEIYRKNNINNSDPQEKWRLVTKACTEAATEILKPEARKDHTCINNDKIKELSEKQKKLRNDINSNKSQTRKIELQKERNKILKEIHLKIQQEEENKLEKIIEEVETNKNNCTKMYSAIRILKRNQQQKTLIIEKNGQIITNEEEQIKQITEYFTSIFSKAGEKDIPTICPKKMTKKFTSKEVKQAIEQLKNNKSPGIDEIKTELLKNSPEIIVEEIANILNTIAETGKYPEELNTGILIPLQKPGKKKGPPSNLRPIILLSVLRKILAICLLKRITEKINNEIPITQAAYREGRSTTEHAFALKILIEKAFTTQNYELHLLLLDMSKAFDTINRTDLLKNLETVLDEDELHLFYILINNVKYQVRCRNKIGKEIKTNIGTPQGDCLSAIAFTFYLAKSLESEKDRIQQEHNYYKNTDTAEDLLPKHLKDHNYATPKENHLIIEQQYADDISYISTNKGYIETIKKKIPEQLKKRNLQVNITKTEEYTVTCKGQEEWKRCKYLGSIPDTTEDIKRRKNLAIDAFNNLKQLYNSKKVSTNIRIRLLDTFVKSIFLYNSELWTTTSKLNNTIDITHRKFLRNILNITWEDHISNQDLYKKLQTKPWSEAVKYRRLSWLGHLLRLPPETPARIALNEAQRITKRPPGRPPNTWLNNIQQDLNDIGINSIEKAIITAKDRKNWQRLITKRLRNVKDGTRY